MKNRIKTIYEEIAKITDGDIIYKRTRYFEDGVFDDTIRIPKDFSLKK